MRALFPVLRTPYRRARQAASNALFDRRYGVRTDGEITAEDLGLPDARYEGYMPAGLRSLRRVLPPRDVDDDDVFLDLGSGKGRVVLQAAMRYPFRRVHGVELDPRLHAVAEENLTALRGRLRCPDVRLVRSDVLDYDIPPEVTVVFLYNPFKGAVFQAVLDRLLASVDHRPRRLRIVYGNPSEEAALLRTGRVRLMRVARGWRPGRDWSRSNSYRLYEVLPAGVSVGGGASRR